MACARPGPGTASFDLPGGPLAALPPSAGKNPPVPAGRAPAGLPCVTSPARPAWRAAPLLPKPEPASEKEDCSQSSEHPNKDLKSALRFCK